MEENTMVTTATRNEHYTATHATEPVSFRAFALREKTWKLGCTMGPGQKSHECTMAARDLKRSAGAWRRSYNSWAEGSATGFMLRLSA
jgi:hypothetical protein